MITVQRPWGITVLAWFSIVSGVINLIFVLSGAWLGLSGILELVFGLGALALKPWAWHYGVIVYVVSISVGVVWLSSDLVSGFFAIIFSSLILYYLFTPGVKRVFGKA